MEHSLRFIEELALLLLLAAGVAYLFSRVRVPPVLGYLVAGVLLGPGGFGLITTVEFVRVLGDLGVVLLMFGLGLDFEINRLRKTAAFSVVAGVASVITTFVVANAVGLLLGLAALEALFLAAGLSICGTAVNLRILDDLGHLKKDYGTSITATIVVTDIAAVLLLTALSGIALGGGLEARTLAFSLFKALAFLVLAPAFGFLIVPRLLNVVARETRSREAILITTLGLCFGMALLSQWLGFSLALGAFVMGMVVSEARVYHPIEEMVKPLEHIFATLFFFSVGFSVSIVEALPLWPAVLVFTAVVAAAKLVSVSTTAYLSGREGLVALAAGWGLVPIGEFTFVIVNEGVRFGALESRWLAVVVAVAILTSGVGFLGLRTARPTVKRLTEWLPAGVLNLLTLLQLRTAGHAVVPGLTEATARLRRGEGDPHGGEADDGEKFRRAVRAEVADIGLNVVIVITITLGLVGLSHLIAPYAPEWLNMRLALAILIVVLCAPSLVFTFKSTADLASLLSVGLAERFGWVDARVTHGALLAVGMFLVFVFLQVIFVPVLVLELEQYSRVVLYAAGGVTLILGFFAWRSLVRFQAGFTNLVRSSLAGAGRTSESTRSEGMAMPGEPEPVPLEAPEPYRSMIEQLEVPVQSELAGRALGESGLRERTGVSVLGIERDGDWIANPGAGETLQPGDELIVLGSEEQRESAERYLVERGEEESEEEPPAG